MTESSAAIDAQTEIQITCKYSIDNQRNGLYDLINDKHQNLNKQLLFAPSDPADKIFLDTVEDLNLARFYLEGYDIIFMKYGKRNVFYEENEANSSLMLKKSGERTASSTSSASDSDESEDVDAESHRGIVQEFLRTVFEELVSAKNIQYVFSIGWTEIISEHNQLIDLLNGNGLVQCYSMAQLIETLAIGLSNKRTNNNHNILSIVLEQQLNDPNLPLPLQKISTINFCDLLHNTDRSAMDNLLNVPMSVPAYPPPPPPPTAIQFPPFMFAPHQQLHQSHQMFNGNYFSPPPLPTEQHFNFQSAIIAQQQSSQLLRNAEMLLSKLSLNDMNETQRREIQDWMYLKSECDNFMPISPPAVMPQPDLPPSYINSFMNSAVMQQQHQANQQQQQQQLNQQNSLLPIIEMDETNDDPEDEETNDNESESGSYIDINDHSNGLFNKISDKMDNFRERTDAIVHEKNAEYFKNNPKMTSSGHSELVEHIEVKEEVKEPVDELKQSVNTSMSEQQYLEKSGRRKSIRDNNVLNSEEMDLIRKAAAATSLENETVKEEVESEHVAKLEELRKNLKKSLASIDATNLQIKEVEQTIALKKNLITDLIENSKTRMTAKSNCTKKKTKYQSEYEKTKKELSRAILAGKSQKEIQRLRDMLTKFEEKLLDLTGINEIATESSSNKKVKQLHKSLEQSKKQLEILNKVLKKEVKHKDSIEKDISKQIRLIEDEHGDDESQKKVATAIPPSPSGSKVSDKLKIRDVNARISHIDEILKEKSSNLQLFNNAIGGASPGEDNEKESLRYEIRNLRRTRDTLLEQRVSLYKKLKREKMLSYKEERKMLECDEAIMAIDDVIEVKNELICGHKSIDTDERLEREKGEQLLMARLNKLSHEEMRILLYKYFMKVIDLKESCRKLEQNLMALERDKEAWEWREKILTNAIRQARLESERNLVIQQKNHETRMNLLLRHFANETATSSVNESNFDTSSTNSGNAIAALPDYEELNIVKATKSRHQYHQQHAQLHHQTEIDREFKKNLFTKFHFTRYHQQGASSSYVDENAVMIPQENLKQLKEKKPATKVTRQKNKLIIQQNE